MWWISIINIVPWRGMNGEVLGFTITWAYPLAIRNGVWIRVHRSQRTTPIALVADIPAFLDGFILHIKQYLQNEGLPRPRPAPTGPHLLYQLRGEAFASIKANAEDNGITLGRIPDVAA